MKNEGSIILLVCPPGVVGMSTYWGDLFRKAGVHYEAEWLVQSTEAYIEKLLEKGTIVCFGVTPCGIARVERSKAYKRWKGLYEMRRIDFSPINHIRRLL